MGVYAAEVVVPPPAAKRPTDVVCVVFAKSQWPAQPQGLGQFRYGGRLSMPDCSQQDHNLITGRLGGATEGGLRWSGIRVGIIVGGCSLEPAINDGSVGP